MDDLHGDMILSQEPHLSDQTLEYETGDKYQVMSEQLRLSSYDMCARLAVILSGALTKPSCTRNAPDARRPTSHSAAKLERPAY